MTLSALRRQPGGQKAHCPADCHAERRAISIANGKLAIPLQGDSFQSGAENIMVYLSAQWPQDLSDSYMLVLHNGVEEQKSLDWYYITTKDGLKFPTPDQKNSLISLEIFNPICANFLSSAYCLGQQCTSTFPG